MTTDTIKMIERLNLESRLKAWTNAQGKIRKQAAHNWTLDDIDRARAELAIQDVRAFIDDLRQAAQIIEISANRTAALLEDD